MLTRIKNQDYDDALEDTILRSYPIKGQDNFTPSKINTH